MWPLRKKAKKIAQIILEVNTDNRGNLLYEVGTELYNQAQGFTGKVMRRAADDYGMNPNLYKEHLKKDR